jgi:DNA-binding response OmpR family regulator
MRGTVLLLDDDRSRQLADSLRLNRLIVYEASDVVEAMAHLRSEDPDVIVACLAPHDTRSFVRELREAAPRATSIIVVAGAEHRDAARAGGADAFLPGPVSAPDLLYEIHRALILRRSGRRLPSNW